MNRKPINPAMHGLIDYGFGVCNTIGPRVLGLTGKAHAIPLVAAVVQGTLNALTNQPFAARRVFPFRMHGRLEALGVPALIATTVITGAWKQPRAPLFYGILFAALAKVYTLTDWNAQSGTRW